MILKHNKKLIRKSKRITQSKKQFRRQLNDKIKLMI